MTEKHIMVSLGDSRIKDISEVIGNKTCNKILDFLAEKEATVTEISNELEMPINTTDYNVKKLVKAGLIENASSWWSVKGKKMPSYRVSDKKIIISPKKYIKKYIFLTLALTGLTAWGLKGLIGSNEYPAIATRSSYVVQPALDAALTQTSQKAASLVPEASNSLSFFSSIGSWQWFLIGAWFAIALFIIINMVSNKRGK